MDFKKQHKELFRCYKKRLALLNKEAIEHLENPMDYFITYLKFMRDYYILTEPLETNGQENVKIAIIASAVAEYDRYKTCINNYFSISKAGVAEKIGEKPLDEINKEYNNERTYHWKAFWNLVSLNMESWMNLNATIQ